MYSILYITVKGGRRHDVKDSTNSYCNHSLGIGRLRLCLEKNEFCRLRFNVFRNFSDCVKGIRKSRRNQLRLQSVKEPNCRKLELDFLRKKWN